jgi:hypothetical protein
MGFYHAFEDVFPKGSDSLSGWGPFLYGMKMKQAFEDGQMGDPGAQVGSTADSWLTGKWKKKAIKRVALQMKIAIFDTRPTA